MNFRAVFDLPFRIVAAVLAMVMMIPAGIAELIDPQ